MSDVQIRHPTGVNSQSTPILPSSFKMWGFILALAIVTTLTIHLATRSYGFNLSDEGFIWYGVNETVDYGAVPLLDYRSYDPGRYYWYSIWSPLIGSGILAMRDADAILKIIGLSFGLLSVFSLPYVKRHWWLLIPISLLLLGWMQPRHKIVESSLAMVTVFFATYLLLRPTLRNHLIGGIVVGLTAFIGRNLGVYAFLGFLGILLLIYFKTDRQHLVKRLGWWLGGVLIGYSPMLLMIIFIPGFAESFVESILFWFRQSSTNVGGTVPWPWEIDLSNAPYFLAMTSIFYVVMPIWLVGSVIVIWLTKFTATKALWIAGTFIGFFYMHHAFSAPGQSHLAQSIHPLFLSIIGATIVTSSYTLRIVIMILLILATRFRWDLSRPESYVSVEMKGDTIWMTQQMAHYVEGVRDFVNQNIGADEEVLIIPYEPGLYPIINRTSPIWDSYILWRSTDDQQQNYITQMNELNVNWVILPSTALMGNDNFHLSATNPILWDYLMNGDTFSIQSAEDIPIADTILIGHVVLRRRTD